MTSQTTAEINDSSNIEVQIDAPIEPIIEVTAALEPSLNILAASQVIVETIANATSGVVEVSVPGPQGPSIKTLAALEDTDVSLKQDNSVLYYNASQDKWVGNDINTMVSLTDGGNF